MKRDKDKSAKQVERHFKGLANHHRISILLLIAERPNITFDQIVRSLRGNEKTLGEHTRRLYLAGLIRKQYRGRFVEHGLSPYGRIFVRFIHAFARDTKSSNP